VRFAAAQTSSKPDAGELPRQAKPISEVVVPIPAEVFDTPDRFSNSNWELVQLDGLAHAKPHGDQTQIALLLGVVIGEGFIAVEAHDAAEVKEVGNAVLALARGLGVEPTVMRRSRSIVELADKNDWPGVRKEWDKVLPDVQRSRPAQSDRNDSPFRPSERQLGLDRKRRAPHNRPADGHDARLVRAERGARRHLRLNYRGFPSCRAIRELYLQRVGQEHCELVACVPLWKRCWRARQSASELSDCRLLKILVFV
jgi:hypothetical protein